MNPSPEAAAEHEGQGSHAARSRRERPRSFRLGISAFMPRRQPVLPVHEPVARVHAGPPLSITIPSPRLFTDRQLQQQQTSQTIQIGSQRAAGYAQHRQDSTNSLALLLQTRHQNDPQQRPRRPRGWTRPRQRSADRLSNDLRLRTLMCALYGVLFLGLLVTLIALITTAANPVPNTTSIPLTLVTIIFAILFLHSLLRIAMLAHNRGHVTHHITHASQTSITQRRKHFLLPYGFLLSSTRLDTSERRRRPHRPQLRALVPEENLTPSGSGLTPLNLPSAYGPDALPDDDSIYSPTTPVRVHMVHDEELDDKHAAAVCIDSLPTPTSPPSTHPLSATSPTSAGVPSDEAAHRDRERQLREAVLEEQPSVSPTTTTSPSPSPTSPSFVPDSGLGSAQGMPRAPPPAYGLWRCSVRADPNLLHWRRVDELAGRASRAASRRFSSPAGISPVSPASAAIPPTPLRMAFTPASDQAGLVDGEPHVGAPPLAAPAASDAATAPPDYETLSNIHHLTHSAPDSVAALTAASTTDPPAAVREEVPESAAVRHISQLLALSPRLDQHQQRRLSNNVDGANGGEEDGREDTDRDNEMLEAPTSAGLVVPVLFYPSPSLGLRGEAHEHWAAVPVERDEGHAISNHAARSQTAAAREQQEEDDVQAVTRAILRGYRDE